MPPKTRFELLPEDLQGYIASSLRFTDVLELHQTSTNFRHVVKHVAYIKVTGRVNMSVLVSLFGNKLKTLELVTCNISPEMLKQMMQHVPQSLRVLNLVGLKLRTRDMPCIIPYLPKQLQVLNLSYNYLGSRAMKHMMHLPKSLLELNLRSNQLGVTGLLELMYHIPKQLCKLDVTPNLWYRIEHNYYDHVNQIQNSKPNITIKYRL